MAKSKLSLENSALIWDSKRRYKVNTIVTYLGVVYQNLTGKNTDPTLLTDWYSIEVAGIDGKLDKGTYTGDAGMLDERIEILENVQDLNTSFTGQAYAIWTGVGLTYDVIYPDYYIEGVLYPGATEPLTLDTADPTNPRQDVIAVDATGAIKITGNASPDPVALSVDTKTQIYVSTVFIAAGATTPTGVGVEVVYDENVEWNNASNFPSANPNATVLPFKGAKHFISGAFTSGQYLRFTSLTPKQITDYDPLKFYVNLRAVFSNSTKFSIRLYNGSTLISSIVTIDSGTYNFDRTIINTYQAIIIPISAFTFSNSTFDRIDIIMSGANTSGFYFDYFALFTGSGFQSTDQNTITSIITDSGVFNATMANDTFTLKGGNGAVVSATGKTITVTPANQTKSQVGLGNVDNTSDLNKPVSTAQQTALDLKLDASSYNQHFKGVYVTLSALNAAHPTASIGDYAQVNEVGGTDVLNYNWDNEESIWVAGGGTGGAANTDALQEGSSNLYFTSARVLATLLSGLSLATGGAIVSTDSVLVAFGKIQKQITDNTTAISGKGDMTTTTAQTVSGVKTFLAGMFGIRNTANTFTSFFANAVTASRTWTFPDKNGIVAMISDIPQNTINTGTQNYVPKYGAGGTSLGNGLIYDNGLNIGIGTPSPISPCTLYQSATGLKGFAIVGFGYNAVSPNDPNNGVGIYLNYNASGNRQLFIGATDALGNSSLGMFRFQTGTAGYAGIDAIAGNGTNRLLTILGNDTENVGVGYDNSLGVTVSLYIGKLNSFTYNENKSNLLLRKFGSQNGKYLDIVNSSNNSIMSIESDGSIIAPKIVSNGLVRFKNYTVASLPTGTQGDNAYVTDALTPVYLAVVVGGGTTVTPVFYNGTNWVCH
jgi:hypothetical protein